MLKTKCDCSHDIKLKNLSDGDIVNHSLLLIVGSVNPTALHCTSSIKLTVGKEFLRENISTSGDFKFILDLNCYWRETKATSVALRFECCNSNLQIQVILDVEWKQIPYRVQPLYILCCDEEESDVAKLHCKIIDLNLRLVQAIFADRIKKAGFNRTTFALNGDCVVYRSDVALAEAWNADGQTLWIKFAEELLRKNRFQESGNRKLKLVAFIGCTKYDGEAVAASGDFSYTNIKKHLRGHAALGGGELALFGSAFFYAWPHDFEQIVSSFLNEKPVNLLKEADESNYRRTYGGVYASTLGAVCHEIGHIFDLGHDEGIMGTGFDYVNRLLTVNSRTENLPKRIFRDIPPIAESNRLTQVRRNQNFLESYRKQKENDGFFFTRNCALILASQPWFKKSQTLDRTDAQNLITFNAESGAIQSELQALKIIEIRSNTDSQVACFYEMKDSSTFKFTIPSGIVIQYRKTHHLFVMSDDGLSKRLDFH